MLSALCGTRLAVRYKSLIVIRTIAVSSTPKSISNTAVDSSVVQLRQYKFEDTI